MESVQTYIEHRGAGKGESSPDLECSCGEGAGKGRHDANGPQKSFRPWALVSLLAVGALCIGASCHSGVQPTWRGAAGSESNAGKSLSRRTLLSADVGEAHAQLHIAAEPARRALTESPYYQKYEPGPPFQHLDVSTDDQLKIMLNKVAYKKEIIMFAFNAADVWLDFAASMVNQLRSIGYLHHFAIATENCCRQLHAIYPDAPCVSFELPGDHWTHEQGVTHLWIGRYKLANSIVRAGVNILVIDLDTIFRRDVYADLKAEPLKGASMIHMEEGFANGGLFYLQNPVINGPALWTHDEVWRRADLVMRMIQHDHFRGNTMDQALLNDAINAAGSNGSVYDWPSVYNAHDNGDHPFWQEHNRGNISSRGNGKRWYAAEFRREKVDPAWVVEPEKACGATCQTPEYARYHHYVVDMRPFTAMNISIPLDAPERALPGGDAVELFVGAPLWTFGHGEDEFSQFDLSAVTHLVGVGWGFHPDDGGNAARRSLMAAAGAWTKADPGRKYATLAHHLITPEDLATRAKTAALIRRFVAAAHELGRVPAMFGFKCEDAAWVKRRDNSRLGVYDKRVVKHGDRCYAQVGGRRCYHHVMIYDFEIEHTTLPPRTLESFADAFEHNASHVMHLRHLPEVYDEKKVDEIFKRECPKYFVPDSELGPDSLGY